MTGIHVKADKSNPTSFKYAYSAIPNKATAVPNDDVLSKIYGNKVVFFLGFVHIQVGVHDSKR